MNDNFIALIKKQRLEQRKLQMAIGSDFEYLTLHKLRRTNATLLLNNGIDLKIVSEHLGHADIQITAGTYTAVLDSSRKKTADLMEQILTEQTTNKHQICLPTTTTPCATSITLTLHLGRGLRPMPVNTKRLRSMQAWAKPFHIYCRMAHCQREYYLFENCGARRAALRPYFFLSFILGSLVKKPAFLSAGRYSSESTSRRALEIPCLIAPA